MQDRDAVIFEDEISTGGTLTSTVQTLKQSGVRNIHAGAVHGVLCGPAVGWLNAAEIESIVVTNTVHLPSEKTTRERLLSSPWHRSLQPPSNGYTVEKVSGRCSNRADCRWHQHDRGYDYQNAAQEQKVWPHDPRR